jgi:hypothetical protein
VEQLSAKLLAVANAGDAVQLVDANVDQLLQPEALIMAPLLVRAAISEQLFKAVAHVGHATSTVAPGQRASA